MFRDGSPALAASFDTGSPGFSRILLCASGWVLIVGRVGLGGCAFDFWGLINQRATSMAVFVDFADHESNA